MKQNNNEKMLHFTAKLLHFSFLPLLLLIMTCCSGHSKESSRLDLAESLMEEHPDSALNLLEKLKTPENATDWYRAKYGLLLTQARYKNFIDENDDSLIHASSDYFLEHGDANDAGMALFLQGMIQKNAGKLGDAAVSLSQAVDLGKSNGLYFIEALGARGLYFLYVNLFNGAEQIQYARMSHDAFVKGGYTEWIPYAKLCLAEAYNNAGKYPLAIAESKEIIGIARNNKDTTLLSEAIRLIGLSQDVLGNKKESLLNYAEAYSLNKSVLSRHDKSKILITLSEISPDSVSKEAVALSHDLNADESISIPFEIYASRGDFEKAFRDIENYRMEQDSVLATVLQNNVADALTNYEQTKQKLHRERIKNERLLWTLIVAIVLISSFTVIYMLRKNLQEKERQQEAIINNAESIKADLLHQIETNAIVSSSIKELFRQNYSLVNNLCATYYESSSEKSEKKRIITEVEKIVHEFSDDKKTLNELREYADKYTNGSYSAFRKDFPGLKEDEYRMFLYIMLGFSARSISLFLRNKIDIIYNHKARLKTRIKNSSAARKMEYLEYFSITG